MYGETLHFNIVPKTAMVGPACFIGTTQPRMYPPNQWLPPWNLPNDTPAFTARAETSTQQVGFLGLKHLVTFYSSRGFSRVSYIDVMIFRYYPKPLFASYVVTWDAIDNIFTQFFCTLRGAVKDCS